MKIKIQNIYLVHVFNLMHGLKLKGEYSRARSKFKKLLEGSKAKAVTEGYSLNLISQTTDGFSLEQNVPSNGENVKIVYNFQRTGMK